MFIYKSADLLQPGKGIGIAKNVNGCNTNLHIHDYIEIVYVVSGKSVHCIDDVSYKVGRGDVLFINYGSSHAISECEDFLYYNIYFSPKIISDGIITQENALSVMSLTAFEEMRMDQNGGRISFTGNEMEEVEFILNSMLVEYENSKPYSDNVMGNYLSILFTKMLRKTIAFADDIITKSVWDDLKVYIDDNLGEKLTLSALSEKIFYNPSYFSRMFKQKFGCSLTDYLTKKRIDLAKELLKTTNIPVEKILTKSGFTDRGVFYHAFTKYTGMTPNEYRSCNKK